MFIFQCQDFYGHQATIRIQSLQWTELGDVQFECNDDKLACTLLTQCRCDSTGHFNLLAGSKPLWVEQWLDYLEDQKQIQKVSCEILPYEPERYPSEQLSLTDPQAIELLDIIYGVGGFNKLQINRYLKNRNNHAMMSTRYSQEDLQRYKRLGDAINYVIRIKKGSGDK